MTPVIKPETMAEAAAHFVKIAKDAMGADLDYSPDSLLTVDQILRGYHTDKDAQPADLQDRLLCASGYIGEVLARHGEGRWRTVSELSAEERSRASVRDGGASHVFERSGVFVSIYDQLVVWLAAGPDGQISRWANSFTHSEFTQHPAAKEITTRGLMSNFFGTQG